MLSQLLHGWVSSPQRFLGKSMSKVGDGSPLYRSNYTSMNSPGPRRACLITADRGLSADAQLVGQPGGLYLGVLVAAAFRRAVVDPEIAIGNLGRQFLAECQWTGAGVVDAHA